MTMNLLRLEEGCLYPCFLGKSARLEGLTQSHSHDRNRHKNEVYLSIKAT